MKLPVRGLSLAVFIIVFCFSLPNAFSAITLEKDSDPEFAPFEGLFKGTLVITSPDGKITILEAGDAVPELSSGSAIEVFDGHFKVSTKSGDEVIGACLGYQFKATGGASMTISCSTNEGMVYVRSGEVTLTNETGEVVTIKAPDTYPIAVGKAAEPLPTAEGELTGFPVEGEIVPDSRNIDNSPST